MTQETFNQIGEAYRRMAEDVLYRPSAPSDGMGTITVPESELNLQIEQSAYARQWWSDEDRREYFIGCPTFSLRKALIWTVEAGRLLCGAPADTRRALKLLEMVCEEVRHGHEAGHAPKHCVE